MSLQSTLEPVIIVTGANRGLGFGICHRLLVDLASEHTRIPPISGTASISCGLTLLLACRDEQKAQGARIKLLQLLDKHVRYLKKRGREGGAKEFQNAVKIEVFAVDLSSSRSIFEFTERIRNRVTYVSHFICNAGMATFSEIDSKKWIQQITTDPRGAVRTPRFVIQTIGQLTIDGLGLVWQNNIFGHYLIYRELESLFLECRKRGNASARVIWISTLNPTSVSLDMDDWQLARHRNPYEASKYQMELLATYLNQLSLLTKSTPEDKVPNSIHIVTQPGVLATNLDKLNNTGVRSLVRTLTLFITRCAGSHDHPRTTYQGAVSAVHAAMAIEPVISGARVKLNTQSPIIGSAYVKATDIFPRWDQSDTEMAEFLLKKFEETYETLRTKNMIANTR